METQDQAHVRIYNEGMRIGYQAFTKKFRKINPYSHNPDLASYWSAGFDDGVSQAGQDAEDQANDFQD